MREVLVVRNSCSRWQRISLRNEHRHGLDDDGQLRLGEHRENASDGSANGGIERDADRAEGIPRLHGFGGIYVNKAQKRILFHSLGLDHSKKPYRHHFVTGPETTDWADCEKLCEEGLMKNTGAYPYDETGSGSCLFVVTPAGFAAAGFPPKT